MAEPPCSNSPSHPEPKDEEVLLPQDDVLQEVLSFDDMGLSDNLLRGIYTYGFEKPSVIQQRTIIPFIQGSDILANAQAGTGKTAAFAISIIQQLDFARRSCQALILTPTRELAMGTQSVVNHLGEFMRGDGQPFCHTFVGGVMIREDVEKFQNRNVLVVVGTPGRVHDLMKRGIFRTDDLRMLVIDEADEILSLGFSDSLDSIFSWVPKRGIQVAIFSNVAGGEVQKLAAKTLRNPMRIVIETHSKTVEGTKQYYVVCDEEHHKLEILRDLFDCMSSQSVIYCNTRRKVEWLSEELKKDHYANSCLTSQMTPTERTAELTSFRSGNTRCLLMTDLISHGIDVSSHHVTINYDMPLHPECYLHRIGRSGCYGRRGLAINLITTAESQVLRDIEAFYNTRIDELPMDFANSS
eukprot:PhF_6_TR9195/c1_g1_i9/m.14377